MLMKKLKIAFLSTYPTVLLKNYIVLSDEINRATPKTQSALLEAMQEHRVTAGGTTYTLDEPFIVLATQNPLEMEGTYPLPEAQLDRFMLKLIINFPSLPPRLRCDAPSVGFHLV